MPDTAEHCGDPTHVRVIAVGDPLGQPDYTTRARTVRRPTLIVDEDYEPVFYQPRQPVDFDPATFNSDDVWIATNVQRAFTSYHKGTTPKDAIANIRTVLANAAAQGRQRR